MCCPEHFLDCCHRFQNTVQHPLEKKEVTPHGFMYPHIYVRVSERPPWPAAIYKSRASFIEEWYFSGSVNVQPQAAHLLLPLLGEAGQAGLKTVLHGALQLRAKVTRRRLEVHISNWCKLYSHYVLQQYWGERVNETQLTFPCHQNHLPAALNFHCLKDVEIKKHFGIRNYFYQGHPLTFWFQTWPLMTLVYSFLLI